jgi:hypothetical protein
MSEQNVMQGGKTDNAAAIQLQVTKAQVPFLSTLAAPGLAQFLTVLKPCSILLPHNHQRANEFYSVLFGTFSPFMSTIRSALPSIVSLALLEQQALQHTAVKTAWHLQILGVTL